jgi:predicted ATPase
MSMHDDIETVVNRVRESYPSQDGPLNPRAIVKIEVERLFGHWTYVIPDASTVGSLLSRLLILYGDNGSGKTTLLRMIFNLLSPARGGGFKTALANTPFQKFSSHFADGTVIAAIRSQDRLLGDFDLLLKDETGEELKFHVPVNPDNVVRIEGVAEKEYFDFLNRVQRLQIALYYLSDDRQLHTIKGQEQHSSDESDEVLLLKAIEETYRLSQVGSRTRALLNKLSEEKKPGGFGLASAILSLEQWMRQQALGASNRGEENANTFYTDVIKRIVSLPRSSENQDSRRPQEIKDTLRALSERSASFASFGLTSKLVVEDLLKHIDDAEERTVPIISNVLAPYIDGIKARLDALQEIRDIISTFLKNINELYTNKQVNFDLREGLTVRTEDGEFLPVEFLSSGEKHLLLLLCNTIVARDRTSIFVIDEPEISLNVKWQRRLVGTLLDCVRGSNVQFILATHSIELLSKHRNHVVKLQQAHSRTRYEFDRTTHLR